jgi:5-methylcytosine-specific restriction endonuclease McrA
MGCSAAVDPGARLCGTCTEQRVEARLEAGRTAYRLSRGEVRCPDCQAPIANDGSYQRRCEPCRHARWASAKRAGRQVRRHRERVATVERFDPLEVLKRDGWRCHLCGCRTPQSRRGSYAPNAPELDHIVPLARGGAHSRANTACACRRCNLAKSDSILGQPSLLSWAA